MFPKFVLRYTIMSVIFPVSKSNPSFSNDSYESLNLLNLKVQGTNIVCAYKLFVYFYYFPILFINFVLFFITFIQINILTFTVKSVQKEHMLAKSAIVSSSGFPCALVKIQNVKKQIFHTCQKHKFHSYPKYYLLLRLNEYCFKSCAVVNRSKLILNSSSGDSQAHSCKQEKSKGEQLTLF